MTRDANCLFCQIVAGEASAQVVWEGEGALAFRDIDPQAPVHVLVVPKEHHRDLSGLSAADPDGAVALLRGIADVAAQERIDDGYRVVLNTGPAAGQTVFHCHAHVLGGRALTWPPG